VLRPASAALLTLLALAACKTSAPPPAPAAASADAAPAPAAQPRTDVLVSRARALRAEGDVEGASARLEAALQLAPEAADVRVELADLLVADGRDLDRAAALLAGVQAGGGARLHLVRARLAEAQGDDAAAAAEYELALATEDDPDARLRRALALERLGRDADALAELTQVRADRPDDTLVRARLAERLEGAGRLAEAEEEYRWLAEAQPDRAGPWERLARFYERSGRAKEARWAAERAREAAGARQDRALRPLLPSRR
jgi:tetratricopeptide (TPR) repeat protein